MNRDWVLFHLGEAQREIASTIADLKADPDFDDAVYWPAMQHLYHHLNTAWNARNATTAEVDGLDDATFNRWCSFPADLPMMRV